jgi:arylsulfatase A-like enzyme
LAQLFKMRIPFYKNKPNKQVIPIASIMLLSICVTFKATAQKKATPQRPNIVIFLADDQGWGDLSINGNKNIYTPNIDAIGKRGARFSKFYVQPVCSPTRAELLTGRYHTRSGVYHTSEGGERMNLKEITMGDIFKKAGYATGLFGKWHNGGQHPYHPNSRGFDEFYGFCSGHWGEYVNAEIEHNGDPVKSEGYLSDDLTTKAIGFIDQHKQEPFLLFIPYNTPHSPMQVPDTLWERYKNKPITMRATDSAKENINFTRAALAMCENIDKNVGRVMNHLQKLNLTNNTIVLYFSDNGPNSHRWNGNMKGIKGSTDEGGVRSPLLMQYPKVIKPKTVISTVTGAIDLLPTLVALTGIQATYPNALDGVSFKQRLSGKKDIQQRRYTIAHWDGRISVRNERYRLDHTRHLYNMQTDPLQQTDIASKDVNTNVLLTQAALYFKNTTMDSNFRKPFPYTIGAAKTILTAGDGSATGAIKRSNQYANSSFFTNWVSIADSIIWNTEVLESGTYEVYVNYTCTPESVGSVIQLNIGNSSCTGNITTAFDQPLRGMEHDKVVRIESYVKDFAWLKMSTITLQKGKAPCVLKAVATHGMQVMDVKGIRFIRTN